MSLIKKFIKRKNHLILFPFLGIIVLMFLINVVSEIILRINKSARPGGYFVKTAGCTIPKFDPFDASILKFYFKVKPLLCHNASYPPLVDSDHKSLWIVEENFLNYGIRDRNKFKCLFTPFYRISSEEASSDERYEYSNVSYLFQSVVINFKHEFIKVECYYEDNLIYKDFHSFVIKQNKELGTEPFSKTGQFNILIIGIDSVSRLNFHRTMPKTLKLLLDSEAIEFKGYNKVGYNTYPNLIAVLTGLSVKELHETCYSGENLRFDKCHFIWNNYSDAGYYTAFAEDANELGLFTYSGRRDFIEKPTDYYWRTFTSRAEAEIGHTQLKTNLCLGPRKYIDVLLSYVKKFATTMLDSPYFGLFWETSTTHDFLNFPMLIDDSYETLLKSLTSDGLLNNTVLVVMSDHGMRWGDIRLTEQGQIEERLPFLYFLFPENFKRANPLAVYNMNTNTRKLTTPFDLHETLKAFLNPEQLTDLNLQQMTEKKDYLEDRGISLFLPIDENRTCESASIDVQWCTCHRIIKIDVASPLSLKVAGIVVDHINSLLANQKRCAKLIATKILAFGVMKTSLKILRTVKSTVMDYLIVLETFPGNGLFEATVTDSNVYLQVIGVVSRINTYGNQSECIEDSNLKLYCYCNDDASQGLGG